MKPLTPLAAPVSALEVLTQEDAALKSEAAQGLSSWTATAMLVEDRGPALALYAVREAMLDPIPGHALFGMAGPRFMPGTAGSQFA